MTSFGIGRYLYSNSIWVEIPVTGTKADYDTKEYVFNWLIYLALMSIITEFVGLFIGYSLIRIWVSLGSIIAHGFGSLFTMWFILESWASSFFLYIFLFLCLAPAITEVAVVGIEVIFKLDFVKHIHFRV